MTDAKPARCFIHTDDESLARAVTEGAVTERDAQIIREFAAAIRAARPDRTENR